MNKIPEETFALLQSICQTIYGKKGCNIVSLDVRGLCTIADYFIITEGNVSKHLHALADAVIDVLEKNGRKPIRLEGKRDSDWVVLDYGECIIHFFIPEAREKYEIEQLWAQGKIIDIPLCTELRKS